MFSSEEKVEKLIYLLFYSTFVAHYILLSASSGLKEAPASDTRNLSIPGISA